MCQNSTHGSMACSVACRCNIQHHATVCKLVQVTNDGRAGYRNQSIVSAASHGHLQVLHFTPHMPHPGNLQEARGASSQGLS